MKISMPPINSERCRQHSKAPEALKPAMDSSVNCPVCRFKRRVRLLLLCITLFGVAYAIIDRLVTVTSHWQ